MQLECPNCNCKLNLNISLEIVQKKIFITRLEVAEDGAKPTRERKWIVIGYNSEIDRFLVKRVKEV